MATAIELWIQMRVLLHSIADVAATFLGIG
jgi:hypothetical protein